MSSGARAASSDIAFFGGMTKVVARTPGVEGGRLSPPEVGANVGHLFSNSMNQEQGNTIDKDLEPSSSKALSPFRYNDLQTKVMKDTPSSFMRIFVMRICMRIIIHRYNMLCIYPHTHSCIYFIIYTSMNINRIDITLIPLA